MSRDITSGPNRRDVLKMGGIAAGATLGLVGPVSAQSDDVVEFSEPIEITPEDSGKTFVLTEDFDGGGVSVRGSPGVEPKVTDVVIDGAGHTITNGGISVNAQQSGAENLTIRNFHLDGGGIAMDLVSDSEISNNVVAGIFIEHTHGTRFLRNTLTGSENDSSRNGRLLARDGRIVAWENFSNNTLAWNVARGLEISADLGGTTHISGNVFSGGSRSIFLNAVSSDGPIRFVGNYVGEMDDNGIEVEDGGRLVFDDNVVANNAGHGLVREDFGRRLFAERNVFVGNGGSGIAANIDGHPLRTPRFIENVAASNGEHGFDIGHDSANVRRNVAVDNGGDGLRFTGENATVQRNVSAGNGGVGYVFEAMDSTLKFNQSMSNGSHGVVFDGGGGHEVRWNVVTANDGDGVVLLDSDDNGFSRNTVFANAGEQLVVDNESEDNRFANNVVG